MAFVRRLSRQLGSYKKYAVILKSVKLKPDGNNVQQRGYVYDPRKYLSTSSVSVFNFSNLVSSREDSDYDEYRQFDRKLAMFLSNIDKAQVKYEDFLYIIKEYAYNNAEIEPRVGMVLLRCCSDMFPEIWPKNRLKLGNNVWDLLKMKNCQLTIEMYNAILNVYIQNKFQVEHASFLKNMSVKPNETTFQLLVLGAANLGNSEAATEIVQLMKDEGHGMNKQLFNSLILLYCNQGNIKDAMSTLDLMDFVSIEPSKETYAYLALGYAKIFDFENIFKILNSHELSASGILNIVESTSFSGRDVELQRVLEFLPEYVQINDFTVTRALVELIYMNRPKDALSVLQRIFSIRKQNFEFPRYFLSAIVEMNVPMDAVLEILEFASSFEVVDVLLNLAELSLLNGNMEMSFWIFETLKKKRQVVKPHYYWPLIARVAKSENEIMEILRHMKKLEIKLDFDTLFYFVFPRIRYKYPTAAYKRISENLIENRELCSTFVCFFLNKGFLGSAMTLLKKVSAKMDEDKILQYLCRCYAETQDLKRCALVLKMLNFQNINLARAVSGHEINEFVQAMNKQIEKSKTFVPTHPRDMSIEELEIHLEELRSKKINTRRVLRHLLQAYCSSNKLQKAEDIRQEIEANDFFWSAGMRASLFGLYTTNGMLDKAREQLDAINVEPKKFSLDDFKIIDFACALVTDGQVEVALEILKRHKVKGRQAVEKNCWKLLNALAHSKDSDYLHQMMDILIGKGYCEANNVILASPIRCHLVKGDISAAVNDFKAVIERCNLTPLKQELMTNLAELEVDGDSSSEYSEMLRDVVSLVRKVHGDDIANANLIIALAQSNKMERLNTVLNENVSVILLQRSLKGVPEEHTLSTIMNILESYKNVEAPDLSPLYDSLLYTYHREGKYEEAIAFAEDLKRRQVNVSEKVERDLNKLLQMRKN